MDHYLIQFSINEVTDLDDALKEIESLGVILDDNFHPIAIDCLDNTYVVRGFVGTDILDSIKQTLNIDIFFDSPLGPIKE